MKLTAVSRNRCSYLLNLRTRCQIKRVTCTKYSPDRKVLNKYYNDGYVEGWIELVMGVWMDVLNTVNVGVMFIWTTLRSIILLIVYLTKLSIAQINSDEWQDD